MLATIADSAAIAWPLAVSFAAITLGGQLRDRRRRRRLNRALHELRRPLQALALLSRREAGAVCGETQLTLALTALTDLDREVNGTAPASEPSIVEARALAEAAVGRWRPVAAREARPLELRWRAPGCRVRCDPPAIARALDNLIANALEHGSGAIRIEGAVRPGRLRLFVCDGADRGPYAALAEPARRRAGAAASRWRRDPRRGHGLGVVAEVAAAHDGRFAACRHSGGASAVIELPLVE
jgi:signal transduction histidine kinase